MTKETRKILESLERGEIDSQEAIRMMQGEANKVDDKSDLGDKPDRSDDANLDEDPSLGGRSSLGDRPVTEDKSNQYLRVDVHRLHDDKRQVHVRIPLRIVELGINLGSRYAPELNELDLKEVVEELHAVGEGTIVEVEDLDENQHVLVWIEKT